MITIAFPPYPCGTMMQPFIDCAIELRTRGIDPEPIERITCNVGEGTVHRLWERLAVKHSPVTPYAAKCSSPFCRARGDGGDNSTTIPFLLIRIAGRAIDYINLNPSIALHQRIASAVAGALDLPVSTLLERGLPAD